MLINDIVVHLLLDVRKTLRESMQLGVSLTRVLLPHLLDEQEWVHGLSSYARIGCSPTRSHIPRVLDSHLRGWPLNRTLKDLLNLLLDLNLLLLIDLIVYSLQLSEFTLLLFLLLYPQLQFIPEEYSK